MHFPPSLPYNQHNQRIASAPCFEDVDNPMYVQPRLETPACLIDRLAQPVLKIVGGFGFGSLSAFLGCAAYIVGSTTTHLLAVGNPSFLLAGIVTGIFILAALKCGQIALELFRDMGAEIKELTL